MSVFSSLPRRRRVQSGAAEALATIGLGIAKGFAARKARQRAEAEAQAKADAAKAVADQKNAMQMTQEQRLQGTAAETARHNLATEAGAAASREATDAYRAATIGKSKATAAETARHNRAVENRLAAKQAAGTQGSPEKPSDTEQKLARYLNVFSDKTAPEALPFALKARLQSKLQGKDPNSPEAAQAIYQEVAGVDPNGYPVTAGVPYNLLNSYPELQDAVWNYVAVSHKDQFFGTGAPSAKGNWFKDLFKPAAAGTGITAKPAPKPPQGSLDDEILNLPPAR